MRQLVSKIKCDRCGEVCSESYYTPLTVLQSKDGIREIVVRTVYEEREDSEDYDRAADLCLKCQIFVLTTAIKLVKGELTNPIKDLK